MKKDAVIDVVHKTICSFFDAVADDSEEPMSEKDKLLLEVNKALCNAIKKMPDAERRRKEHPMNNENSYIQIDIEYTNYNFPGVSRFTTAVKDAEHIHDALMEAIRYVEKVGIYKTHCIIVHKKRDEESESYEEGAEEWIEKLLEEWQKRN